MGGVGVAGSNGATESFFALVQNSVLNRQSSVTRPPLGGAIVAWTEKTRHRQLSRVALSRLTPIEFETMMATPVALAV